MLHRCVSLACGGAAYTNSFNLPLALGCVRTDWLRVLWNKDISPYCTHISLPSASGAC